MAYGNLFNESNKMSAWTNKTPTEAGWYWWRKEINRKPTIVEIVKGSEGLFILQVGIGYHIFIENKILILYPQQQWQKVPQPKE